MTPEIRELRKDDIRAVMEIDAEIRGASRPDYWARRFINAEGIPPWASLVAEMGDRMVGFLFGWSSLWDFGVRDEVGWIDVIGVRPAYRRRGVGLALVSEFTKLARDRRGVERVFTLVNPEEEGTCGFFSRIGFAPGRLMQMQRSAGYFYDRPAGKTRGHQGR